MTMIRTALILAAITAATSALPAQAQTDANTISTTNLVAIENADLATDAGIDHLRTRVARAARIACRPVGRTNAELDHARSCVAKAVAQGNAQIDTKLAQRQTAGAPALATSLPGAAPRGH